MVYLKTSSIAIIWIGKLKMTSIVTRNITLTHLTQPSQQFTPCTNTHDHTTQHINNLADTTQQSTLYTNEKDASLFTTDITTPCECNITQPI